MSGRTRLSVAERRAQLIEVGKDVFGARAFDEVSTDDLARAAGISKGLLYHYFGSKRGYYVAVVSQLATELSDATRLDDDAPLDGAMHAALSGFYAFLQEHGSLFRALMRGGIGSDAEVDAVVDSVRQTILRRVLTRFGLSEPPPPLRARLVGWIGCVEAVGIDQVDHGDLSEAAFVDVLVSALMALLPADVT